ncbi:MAG TPA: helix-turn-helix domain-containing protein [Pseudonocardia sp.]|nr:helix-turn-helix domain-containing protein [Pseudonocardia sp.]
MLAVEARFTGVSGLAAMGAAVGEALVPQRLQALDPQGFAASVTSVDLGPVRVVRASAPALRSVRPAGAPDHPDGTVFLLLGRGARGQIVAGPASAPVDPDHVVLVPGDAAFEVTYPEPLDVLFVALDPLRALRLGLPASGPVRGLTLPAEGRALLRPALDAVLAAAVAPGTGPATPLLAGLAEVVEGALAVAVRPAVGDLAVDPAAALRAAALGLVERHLDDPDLGPVWLAARLHVSPSTLHRAFRAGAETVAAAVRRRRVEAVARDLTGPGQRTGVAELAARYGFAGGSHLATAFRARFGTSPADYRAWHGSARDLTPN